MKCTFGNISGHQCPNEATWVNQNGVTVCEQHKLVLDAFNWETRNKRKWDKLPNRLNATGEIVATFPSNNPELYDKAGNPIKITVWKPENQIPPTQLIEHIIKIVSRPDNSP
jgi:hypothetical protein